MKFLAALLLSSHAALAAAQEPPREHTVGQALDDFATIAGAWHLNQRCDFIAEAGATAFDSDVATINVALAKDLHDPRILLSIQAASKSVAESEKYASCDDKARSIVMDRVAHAHAWAERIRIAKGRETQAN